MEDWNDYRLFAELARAGAVRTAAKRLGTSHSTLSRRMRSLEARLGVTLFERSTTGFELTEAGRTLNASIMRAEAAIDEGRRTLDGADTRMAGPLCATMPDFLAYSVLLPAVGEFARTFPDVTVEIEMSYDAFDLAKREADVAVRMVHVGQSPPPQLVGRRVATSHATGYASPAYLERYDIEDPEGGAAWLGWDVEDDGSWVRTTSHPHLPLAMSLNSAQLQQHAARQGLGLAVIPCLLGDADPGLVRVSGAAPKPARDIWVLTHEDLRETARMRAFRDAMTDALRSSAAAMRGEPA